MKKTFLFLLLIGLIAFIANILISTGAFRSVENEFKGKTLAKIEIPGVEDITVDEDDDFAVFISYDRAAERDGKAFKSGIYSGLQGCETVYFDGENYRVVANNSSYANGINYDKKRGLVYIAGVRDFSIKVYDRKENGDLNFVEEIDCGTGVDNIELDSEGNVWIGCHPNMLAADAYMKGNADKSPSEIIKITYRAKGDYEVETVYLNDGTEMSVSTVAAIYGDLMLLGNVCDEHFLVLERE